MKQETAEKKIAAASQNIQDERTMIREQERLARERKRRKNRKKKYIAAALTGALLAAGVWYLGWGRSLFAAEEQNTVTIVAESGQQIIYAQLASVKGNEITYLTAQEEEVTSQIPVGTDVTTRLGTVTTFSRLAAGDKVALVVQEEDGEQIIMAVYIIG